MKFQHLNYSTKVESTSSSDSVPLSRMKIPSNLKFDPRVMKNLVMEERPKKQRSIQDKKRPVLKKEPFASEGKVAYSKKKDDDDSDDNHHDDDDNHEEEEDDDNHDTDHDNTLWFQPPEPQYVIPLPDRLTVPIWNKSNLLESVGTIVLSASIFGQQHIRVDIIKRVVVYQRNRKRGIRYPAKTKTISEVSGSGRKVRKQKGGGVARAGHSRPPHWRGGAKAHGPKGSQQDYTTKLNKHTRKLGLVHALSQKLKEGNLMIVNDFFLESHKTKVWAEILGNAGLSGNRGKSAFLVDWAVSDDDSIVDKNLPIRLTIGTGNLPKIKVSSQAFINVYDILKHEKLILSLSALQAIEERLNNVAY
jgi:large subunit ribosomal protein L4